MNTSERSVEQFVRDRLQYLQVSIERIEPVLERTRRTLQSLEQESEDEANSRMNAVVLRARRAAAEAMERTLQRRHTHLQRAIQALQEEFSEPEPASE